MNGRRLATFTLDDGVYGIDVQRVQEVVRAHAATPVPLAPPHLAGLANLRGQVVMVIDLRSRLGLARFGPDAAPMMVVVEVDGEAVGLVVDAVGDVVDTDEAELQPPPPTLAPALRQVIVGAYPAQRHLVLVLDADQAATL